MTAAASVSSLFDPLSGRRFLTNSNQAAGPSSGDADDGDDDDDDDDDVSEDDDNCGGGDDDDGWLLKWRRHEQVIVCEEWMRSTSRHLKTNILLNPPPSSPLYPERGGWSGQSFHPTV